MFIQYPNAAPGPPNEYAQANPFAPLNTAPTAEPALPVSKILAPAPSRAPAANPTAPPTTAPKAISPTKSQPVLPASYDLIPAYVPPPINPIAPNTRPHANQKAICPLGSM